MKYLLNQDWSFMRIIRIVGGSYLTITGFLDQEYIFIGIGAFILIQGILNTGCGGTCTTNSYKTKSDDNGKV